MRKVLPISFEVALAAAGPAGASHRTGEDGPHKCLGEFHSSTAQNPAFHPLGQVVANVLVPAYHPFGREFVKGRASECEGLE